MPWSAALLDDLSGLLGPSAVLSRTEDLIPYSFDGTASLSARPGAVIFPRSTDEVARCVAFAAAHRIPIVCRGSGTGLSGGSVPVDGCLVLCLAQMDRILAVDTQNLTLTAQPGVITQAID